MLYFAVQYLGMLLRQNETTFQKYKWIGNACLMTAASTVAISAEWAQAAWPFVFYTIGCIMWLYAGIIMKDKALIGQNAFFAIIDIYAIFIRL